MKSYDNLIKGLIILFFIICSIYLFWVLILQYSTLESLYLVFDIFIIFICFIYLIYYLISLRKERVEILDGIKSLEESGIKVLVEKYEKLLYSRDIADIPKMARIIFDFNCLAIFIPRNIGELKNIVKFCSKYSIPIIPRGTGTSGYGGAIPVKNGVIIILTELNNIIQLNEERLYVTVESGVIWNQLISELKKKNLSINVYPSSAPSSTVGGWIAQGGYGIGSAMYGSILQSVHQVILINSKGEEVIESNPEKIVGSCGTTGIIWKVALKVRPQVEINHVAFSTEQQDNLIQAASILQKELNPYYIQFDDFQNYQWKSGNTTFKAQVLGGGLLLFSYFKDSSDLKGIKNIERKYDLKRLPPDIATHLWGERFNTIKAKRHGPSLILAEVVVPTEYLIQTLDSLNNRYSRAKYAIELITTSDGVSILMVLFPADYRKKSLPIIGSILYTFYWVRSFDVIQILRKYHVSPYSTGLWLSGYRDLVLKQKVDKMKTFKMNVDSNMIFNPGKLWGLRIPRFLPIIPITILKYFVPILSGFYGLIPKNWR